LGYAHHRLGNPAEAIDCYRHALELIREFGARREEADTLMRLAEAFTTSGDRRAARVARRRALDILDELGYPTEGHPDVEQLTTAERQ
jgi:tetratricopeptide (TPR) repeat protein